jgi:hypothetical protein
MKNHDLSGYWEEIASRPEHKQVLMLREYKDVPAG